ncbi:MAG: homoserine dehydrogenase [Rickettsiales bacterium]|nr:homoserine dehydrogenase [Rickettsiales bacterium]|tara:strand:- start:639 stop:1931 length:1293 start_codon:yes stop_codon:yes gene_type:complete
MKMKTIKLAIAGLGTVGSNVIKSIEKINKDTNKSNINFDIIGISAANKSKKRVIDISNYIWFDDAIKLCDLKDCDILIELIGNQKGLSYEIVKKALKNKINVVTANKALLAHHGNELFELAELNNVKLLFEAAVAGGIPIIKILKNSVFLNKINNIVGILNGTTNFILSQMEENNFSFDDALKLASEKGYAEADPTNDIDGIDSAHKITLLASLSYGIKINHINSNHTGISKIKIEDIKYAIKLGYKIKLISEANIIQDKIYINTSPKLVNANTSLANVDGVLNAINIETDHLKSLFIEGEGAGGAATSSSIMSDIYELSIENNNNSLGYSSSKLVEKNIYESEDIKNPYYLRLLVKDQPGVLSKITSILTSKNISIQTILQLNEDKIDNKIPIILTTYETIEKNLKNAINDINKENFLENDIISITIHK